MKESDSRGNTSELHFCSTGNKGSTCQHTIAHYLNIIASRYFVAFPLIKKKTFLILQRTDVLLSTQGIDVCASE